MEPRIKYAKTSDGVSIAFWTLGRGEPVVIPPVPGPDTRLRLHIPDGRRFFERFARQRMLVLYDGRGQGLSDRGVSSFSLGALVLDLAAVVDHLRLERFALGASGHAGPPAVVYAVTHPERVSRLVLWNTYARGADVWQTPRWKAFLAMREADYETYTETIALTYLPGEEFALQLRESMTPQARKGWMDATRGFNVTHLLPRVGCPTLVLFAGVRGTEDVKMSRTVASLIPGAQLVVLGGGLEAAAEAVEDFLGLEGSSTEAIEPAVPAFRTVLFTDLVGHTEMMSRLGDERGREVLRQHERITREVLKAHGGTEVKTMGDGFMASFGSVTKAVECGIALQHAVDARNMELGTGNLGERLEVRCGLNAGEPIEEEGDLFGATVILASRIAAKAEGGEILVADTVRGLCSGKGFLFADRGEFVAKGFEEPVRVYLVKWRKAG